MDARAALRRLLQQRLEAGETTIVLETLQADVILSAARVGLSEAKERSSSSASHSLAEVESRSRRGEDTSFASPRMTGAAPEGPVRESLAERRAGPPDVSGDWRSALRPIL